MILLGCGGRAQESYTKAGKKNDNSTKRASRIYMVAYSNVLEMKYNIRKTINVYIN